MVASVAAGRSLTHALTTLAETGPPALRDAFARFPLLARMLGTVPALEVVKAELADPTSDRVIEVLILAHERGGPIVRQILEDLVVATTKDLKVLDEIESEGLEMKINARAVLVMPWLVLVALTLRDGPFRAFYRSPAGLFSWWWAPLPERARLVVDQPARARARGAARASAVPRWTGARVTDPASHRVRSAPGLCRGRRRGARRAADPPARAPRAAVHRDRRAPSSGAKPTVVDRRPSSGIDGGPSPGCSGRPASPRCAGSARCSSAAPTSRWRCSSARPATST